jgi:peptide/nickel transport system substrate-binding protein
MLTRRHFLEVGAGAVATTSLVGAIGCGGDDAEPAAGGDGGGGGGAADRTAVLNWATDEPASTFDTATAADLGGLVGIDHLFEALTTINAEGTADPQLIEGPPEVAGTDVSVVLKDGITFHDGTPMTADDVVFTFERHLNPDTGSILGPGLAVIDSVIAEGDNRVIFSLKQESDYFPITLGLVRIVSAKAFQAAGAEKYANNPVGSGPFRVAAFTPQVEYEMSRFDGYWGDKPALGGVKAVGVADPASRVSQMRSGGFEVIDHVPITDVAGLGSTSGIEVGETLGSAQLSIEFEHSKPPFDDLKVRQAFMYALDRDAINEVVFQGKAKAAHSMLPEESPYFVEPQTKYEYDPERAKSLMREAGYGGGTDFELMVKSDTGFAPPAAQVMQEQLGAIGLNPSLRLIKGGAGYGLVVEGKYQAFLSYYNIALFTDPLDFFYRFTYYGGNREAYYRWNDASAKRMDELIDAAYAAPSFEARKAAYAEAQEHVNQAVPGSFPILYTPVISAWREAVQGYEPQPDDLAKFRSVSIAA